MITDAENFPIAAIHFNDVNFTHVFDNVKDGKQRIVNLIKDVLDEQCTKNTVQDQYKNIKCEQNCQQFNKQWKKFRAYPGNSEYKVAKIKTNCVSPAAIT